MDHELNLRAPLPSQQQHSPIFRPSRQPSLPLGYTALNQPRPLVHPFCEWWMVRARNERYEAEGILIYEDCYAVAFLDAEEATTLAYTLLEGSTIVALLGQCSPSYLNDPQHAAGIKLLRDVWGMQETEKARALGAATPVQPGLMSDTRPCVKPADQVRRCDRELAVTGMEIPTTQEGQI